MIIGLIFISLILGTFLLLIGLENCDGKEMVIGSLLLFISIITFVFGCFRGFINYPATEGTHQGVITAVDLEGKYFRRYEVYLKSSGYTGQSDETKYLLYEYEKELAEKLKTMIGKEVKLSYGHEGGYIDWKSCGTYHIKNVEEVDVK